MFVRLFRLTVYCIFIGFQSVIHTTLDGMFLPQFVKMLRNFFREPGACFFKPLKGLVAKNSYEYQIN